MPVHYAIVITISSLIATGSAAARAGSPSADIDPGRMSAPSNFATRPSIDPQPLHVDRINMNSIDPQAIRMDTVHFKSIDPGRAIQPNVAPQWMESRALTVPTLGIQKLDPGRLSMFKEDPGTLEAGRLRLGNQVFNPIDPGRLHVDPIEKTKIDPGALAKRGTERRERVGQSTIFLSSPVGQLGGPISRDPGSASASASGRQSATSASVTSTAASGTAASGTAASDPRFMPLKW